MVSAAETLVGNALPVTVPVLLRGAVPVLGALEDAQFQGW